MGIFESGHRAARLRSPGTIDAELLGREQEQLRQAVTARSVINMAEGALAVLGQLPIADAGRVLREISRGMDMDVQAVAQRVLDLVQQGSGADLAVDGQNGTPAQEPPQHRLRRPPGDCRPGTFTAAGDSEDPGLPVMDLSRSALRALLGQHDDGTGTMRLGGESGAG